MREFGEIQGIILRRICEQRNTTPYFGLLAGLGLWTIEKQIEYKKIMLLPNILTSNDDRLLKEIVKDQIKDTWPGCWMEHVKVICEKYDINIHTSNGYKKENIKQLVKSKINTSVDNEITKTKNKITIYKRIFTKTRHK